MTWPLLDEETELTHAPILGRGLPRLEIFLESDHRLRRRLL